MYNLAYREGHTILVNGTCTAATGVLEEYKVIREYVPFMLEELAKYKNEVKMINVTPPERKYVDWRDDLYEGINNANKLNVDLFISLHANKVSYETAHGCEVIHYNGDKEGGSLANYVVTEIAGLGYTNRGAKPDTRGLAEINDTGMTAIIVEPFFVSSPSDCKLYDPKKLGKAIAIGILKYLGIEIKKDEDHIVEANKMICTSPTATKTQMDKWAKSHFKDDSYKELLDIYWREGIKKGINPIIPFSQMCHETGFLYKIKSAAGLDASFHNPCGLKITKGGGDFQSTAHKVFKNWEEGIEAHLDHLSLYLGLEGYPKADTPDPRHFPYLLGKVKYVEDLSTTWCPSVSYATKLLTFIKEIENVKVDEHDETDIKDEDKTEEYQQLKNKYEELKELFDKQRTKNEQLEDEVETLQETFKEFLKAQQDIQTYISNRLKQLK